MQLRNLCIVADGELSMALFAKIKGQQVRYNFAKKMWDRDLEITPDKVCLISEFKKSELYKKNMAHTLINWSTFDARKLKGLSEYITNGEIKPKKNLVVNMSIGIS